MAMSKSRGTLAGSETRDSRRNVSTFRDPGPSNQRDGHHSVPPKPSENLNADLARLHKPRFRQPKTRIETVAAQDVTTGSARTRFATYHLCKLPLASRSPWLTRRPCPGPTSRRRGQVIPRIPIESAHEARNPGRPVALGKDELFSRRCSLPHRACT